MTESLAQIGALLDSILNRPLDRWSLEQINLYQTLERKCLQYRKHFLLAQFRQDLKDIQDNIYGQKWYRELKESRQQAVELFLRQMKIMSFNLSRTEEGLRVNLDISLENANLKLQYLNSPNKFLYYLFFEHPETQERAYLAKNHPALESSTVVIPELEKLYQTLLDQPLRKIPAGILLKILTEIILFYEETETVVRTPISSKTEWALFNSL